MRLVGDVEQSGKIKGGAGQTHISQCINFFALCAKNTANRLVPGHSHLALKIRLSLDINRRDVCTLHVNFTLYIWS